MSHSGSEADADMVEQFVYKEVYKFWALRGHIPSRGSSVDC